MITGTGGGSCGRTTATPAKAMTESPSADSAQSEPLSDEGWWSGQRRSHSDMGAGALDVLSAAGVPRQITRMPLNGMRAMSDPSTSVRQREDKAWAP